MMIDYDTTMKNKDEPTSAAFPTSGMGLNSTWSPNTSTTAPYTTLLPFNETDVTLFAVFIFIFLVFGVCANVLTMIVIATSKKLRSIFHLFIFSLCVSDTMSALISWINWYRRTLGFNGFLLPSFLCQLYWAVDILTSYSTALHILSFAVLRLICLRWPQMFTTINKNHLYGLPWIISLWIAAFLCGALPMGLFSGAEHKDRTANTPDARWPECTQLNAWLSIYGTYTYYAYSIFFYIPIVSTVVMSIYISVTMIRNGTKVAGHMSSKAAKSRRNKEKQAIAQLILIVGSFLLGYLPFTAFEFSTFQTKDKNYETWWSDWHFGTAQYMCLRLSECLNPVLYNLGSRKMWKETRKFLSDRGCLKKSADQDKSSMTTKGTPVGEI